MKYLKVKWLHDFNDEPVWLYSELDENRSETRKVEEFSNGEYGYAYEDGSKSTTQLSETYLPSEDEIRSDPQFKLMVISREEFKEVWIKAVSG